MNIRLGKCSDIAGSIIAPDTNERYGRILCMLPW